MNKLKLVAFVIAILLGVFFVIYGGYDDSPGAQLLGLVVTIASAIGIYRILRNKKS